MSRTVLDLELEKLRFELVLQGYTGSEMAKLRAYLCDFRHVILGLAQMTITPKSLPCKVMVDEWLPSSFLTYQDIKLLVIYAKDPGIDHDTDFFKCILSSNEAIQILEAMMCLYKIKSGSLPPDVEKAHEKNYLVEARAFLNYFKGSLPDVMYYDY